MIYGDQSHAINARRGRHYQGWRIDYSSGNPVTGQWTATRFGVEMCAADYAALTSMIDARGPITFESGGA